MNIVALTGRLTHDPEVKQTSNGKPMTTFRLAVNREYKQEGQPDADFLRIVTYGKTAENVGKYCYKGGLVGVTGRIQTGSYTKQDGAKVYTTDIMAERVEFLSKRQTEATPEGFSEWTDDDDSNIPF